MEAFFAEVSHGAYDDRLSVHTEIEPESAMHDLLFKNCVYGLSRRAHRVWLQAGVALHLSTGTVPYRQAHQKQAPCLNIMSISIKINQKGFFLFSDHCRGL